jgi:hypothetical protein
MYVDMVSFADIGNRMADIIPILDQCGALLYVSERNLVAEGYCVHGLHVDRLIGIHYPAGEVLPGLDAFDDDHPHSVVFVVHEEMRGHGTPCGYS